MVCILSKFDFIFDRLISNDETLFEIACYLDRNGDTENKIA